MAKENTGANTNTASQPNQGENETESTQKPLR